ncbi:MAG: hypothetical protein JWP81_4456 [Ferruginibacter sp.]|nr:hypothetical protein [Ferruginibacter sp.]
MIKPDQPFIMQQLIEKFKQAVTDLASKESFIHHKWYVKYHLDIVEKIALELCELHKAADRNLVVTLVWLHDYGKIIGKSKKETLTEGGKELMQVGFPRAFVDKAVEAARLVDKKDRLNEASIEVQIVSSADGASHLTGPFQFFYWYENSDKPFEELVSNNINKLRRDWHKKIVLREVREAFQKRKHYLHELLGEMPGKFIIEDHH